MILLPFIRGAASGPARQSLLSSLSSSSMQMSSFEFLELDRPSPFVTHVKINRPDKRNALNHKLWDEIGLVFQELGEDTDCRSIVLSGNGAMFSAGIDLKDLLAVGAIVNSDEDVARKTRKMYKMITNFQKSFTDLEKCPKPVIAAIHGGCLGAGTNLVCGADVRLCAKDAVFQVKEVIVGLAADVGALQRLPKVIGSQSLVRELCLTGRPMGSEEAERCGFVSKVYEDKESCVSAALSMAKTIAELSPVAVQGTKVNLNFARDHTVDEGLEFVARWNSTMLQSEDIMKAGMAVISKAKEPPTFSKL